MSHLPHIAISASAGSGKTFQLADRFVRLVVDGVPPDRIAALTFSRKAAGEIFDRIVGHLCEASESSAQASTTATRLGLPNGAPETFVAALRSLMDALPRLHVGTLDSFIVGVLRAFPTELGVPPDFQMVDESSSDATLMRERVLDRIFSPLTVNSAIQAEFFEAFKQATFGREEKDIERNLHEFIQHYRAFFQILPDAVGWGQEARIWPQGSPWLAPTTNVAAAAARLTEQIDARDWHDKFKTGLLDIVAAAAAHTPASHWNSDLSRGSIMPRIMAQLDALARGDLTLEYSRKTYRLDANMCHDLLTVLRHMLGIEFRNALRRTAGIHHLLDLFEIHYDTLMRRSGSMTFADAQYLLTEANRYSDGACLSRIANAERRLYIDYRLDCRLDHWLLDEFQDTSDLQWAVLRNLVDEILQDTSQTRSFFYVGDVKQAIYGWRGGNPRLFRDIIADYGRLIQELPLATSYRSAPAIIDTVNALFDPLPEDRLPRAVTEQWQETWHRHDCAPHLREAEGFATIIEPCCPEGQTKPSPEDRYDVVAALLRELNPVQRGLETAILVRRNETGRLLVERLREACPDIPVIHEGKATLRENGVVELFLSLIAFAAHPGDTFAWQHIQMSPLADYLQAERLTRATLSLRLLTEIHALGFTDFIRRWGERLNAQYPLDDYAQHCLDNLLKAAVQFDRTGERDPDAFRRTIDSTTLSSIASPGAVRVMTIHQSKGLGFDIVILPELDGNDITRDTRRSMLLNRDRDTRQPDWILALPNRMVAEADTTLRHALADVDAQSCFENLCVLYVAATRAKRGLYAVTSFAGPSATSFTASEFCKDQLAGEAESITIDNTPAIHLYAHGKRDWFAAHAVSSPHDVHPKTTPAPLTATTLQPLQRLEPSSGDKTPRRAAWLFNSASREVLQFGSAIHALFEQIEWIDDADLDTLIDAWALTVDASAAVVRDAITQFRQALTHPEVQEALRRPEAPTRLWREKRFHLVREGRLVSGIFDRVAITMLDEHPVAATILDFKSDQVESPAEIAAAVERHRQQLLLYRDALAQILNLPPRAIACRLLFSRPGRVALVE